MRIFFFLKSRLEGGCAEKQCEVAALLGYRKDAGDATPTNICSASQLVEMLIRDLKLLAVATKGKKIDSTSSSVLTLRGSVCNDSPLRNI